MSLFSKKAAPAADVEEVKVKKAVKADKEKAEVEEVAKPKKESPMDKLLADSAVPPTVGDLVEGKVIAIDKSAVYINIPPFGTGIIFGREFIVARDIIKKLHIGDSVTAKVAFLENPEGYIELSLKEAKQALVWGEIEEVIKNKTPLELPVLEANKGGLILSWQGVQGFLPASQLKTEHYPRVADGDKDKILVELRKLVGTKITITIIGATPKDGKLIFSEKNTEEKDKEVMTKKYEVGADVEGVVTGIVDFGIFVKLEEGLEGLVHISEIDWALVENPKTLFKVGDKVKVRIIEIKEGKISLSIKALKENPWKAAANTFKKDDVVKGIVIKFNKHGALASIQEGVAGLVHISEFGNEEKLRSTLELGKSYNFKITLFDPKDQKMTLSYVAK